ncbi:MAG: LpxL/LpxP family Kdo(2)-lipid IV(A) lauroyl/palmitoleoyl acyltransferase [Pseudomonadota bacterium]
MNTHADSKKSDARAESTHTRAWSKPTDWPVALALGLLRLISAIPFPYNVRIGKCFGNLLYIIPSRRKHIVLTNLKLCFPELSDKERGKLCKEVIQNYGAGMVETAMAWWADKERLYKLVDIEGLELLETAQQKGKGVLLLGAHFTTLDLGAAFAGKYFDYSLVYKPQRGEYFDRSMYEGRRRHAEQNIKKTELRKLIKTIRGGNIVWYAPDQDDGLKNSVFAPFFGQTAATLTATANLARLTDAPVLMYGQHRKSDDSGYVMRITGPLDNFPSGDEVADATAVNALIEEAVRHTPAQYYWFHRRFKTQPQRSRGELYDV